METKVIGEETVVDQSFSSSLYSGSEGSDAGWLGWSVLEMAESGVNLPNISSAV